MKVTLYGFSLNFPPSNLLSPHDFFRALCSSEGNSTQSQTLAACGMTHNNREWLGGVLIRDRMSKHIAVKEVKEEKFIVTPHDLGDNKSPTDFNFFVLNPATQRGLYQFYHHSVPITQFLEVMDRRYQKIKENEAIKIQQSEAVTEEKLQKIRADVSSRLIGRMIVRQEELPKLLEQLDRIKKIDIEFSSYQPAQQNDLVALSAHARHHVHRLTYSKKSGKDIKATVIEFLAKQIPNSLKKARLEGITPSGLEQVYSLANNPDKLGQGDYDEWVQIQSSIHCPSRQDRLC